MNILLIISLLCGYSFAEDFTYSLERSTSQGSDKVEFKKKKDILTIYKTSNYFDETKDLRLGHFTFRNPKNVSSISKKVEEINKDLIQTDKKLNEYGKDFNGLNTLKNPHEPYIRLNQFIIKSGSILYPRLMLIYQEISKQELQIQEGVVLDEKKNMYVFYKEFKEVRREQFSVDFFCESPKLPTRCLARKWGTFYLE